MWSAPPEPSVAQFMAHVNDIDCTTRRGEQLVIRRDNPIGIAEEIAGAFCIPCGPSVGSTYTVRRPVGLVANKLRSPLKLGHGGAAGRRGAAGVLFSG